LFCPLDPDVHFSISAAAENLPPALY